jgi:phosphate-selective porin OprO/OprP
MAANDAMLELIEIMRKKGSITEEEYKLLKNAAHADAEVAAASKDEVKKEVEKVTKDLPKIETAGKLKVSSQDGEFSWGLIGRVMVDYNMASSDDSKIGDDSVFIRRGRLGMEGAMWKHWIWKYEMDFAEDGVSTKDAYLGYKSGNWWIKTGQSHIPYGLATMSSSKYMTFIERPLLADGTLQVARQLGVAGFIKDQNGRWTFHTGVFGGAVGGNIAAGFDDEVNVAARGTFVPLMKDKNHLLTVGAGVWYRDMVDRPLTIGQDPGIIRIAPNFQSAAFGNQAGATAVDDTLGFNIEGAVVYGPFGLKSEYSHMTVNSERSGVSDVDLDGYYAEASYFLTGESLNYDTGKAQFGSVAPKGIVGKGGIGAWQVAVRYDVLNLNDAVDALGVGAGGDQSAFTAGLNWYVNKNMRFMLNYVHVLELDRPGNVFDNDEPQALTFRGQVYW